MIWRTTPQPRTTIASGASMAAFVVAIALKATAMAQDVPLPTSAPIGEPPAGIAARVVQLGSRGLLIHDPSTVVKCKGEYWLFSTGGGVRSFRSADLRHWTPGPRVFPDGGPAWVRDTIPANRGGNDFWAPEIIHVGGRYFLYYSVSSWGTNTSAIALATNRTLDPADPDYRWGDEGIVVRSTKGADDFNAIDPAPSLDADGKLWLAFGSFWRGIQLIELDPATGKRRAGDEPARTIAFNEQIEGASLCRAGGRYYLFVAWGWCCRGVKSTYNVRVGRSDRIIGPYLDRDGQDLRAGGGTLVLGTDGPFIGPGGPSVFTEGDRYALVCHFYDATNQGRGTLAIRPLTWDADGWPVVGTDVTAPK